MFELLLLAAVAAPDGPSAEEIEAARVRSVMPVFRTLLAVANDANDPAQVDANVSAARTLFEARGFEVRELPSDGGPPLLLAERLLDPELPTLLLYLQLDGQPVDPAAWDQLDPYEAVLKAPTEDGWETLPWSQLDTGYDPEWRVFARAAADAKGPVVMLLEAVRELDAAGIPFGSNIKVVMDFEEELGSPHLPAAVTEHAEALAADGLLVLDGPPHASNAPTLVFGARGIATVQLTVYGPREPVHSGNYGNWVPNPAQRLAQLLAGMKDADGRVVLDGFYDGVELSEEDLANIAAVPDDLDAIMADLGIAAPDAIGDGVLQAAVHYPTLNVRGLSALWTGAQARTLIPDRAVAAIDIRLVPGSDAERLIGLIRAHVEAQGFHLSEGEPTDAERTAHPRIASLSSRVAYGAFRTPLDTELADFATAALIAAHGEAPVRIPTLGGSVPISPFVEALGIPAILVPGVNPRNNQHAPDENLRLGNLASGIARYRALLEQPWPAQGPDAVP